MFNNIAQLENEVQEFEKNILASKELVDQLDSVVGAIKALQTEFSEDSSKLLQTVEDRAASGSTALECAIEKITASNATELEAIDGRLSGAIADVKKASVELLNSLSTENRELLESTSRRLADSIEKLGKISSSIVSHLDASKNELTEKYNDFTRRVEASNMDKIYGKLEELEAAMNKKFTLLLAGVGVAILVGIISIIL